MSDWRLTNQMKYLYQATLRYKKFIAHDSSDHAHCEFCWKKFGEGDESINAGYTTSDMYRWICPQCFDDFRELFGWKTATESGN